MKGFVSSRLHPAANLALLLVLLLVAFCLSMFLIVACTNLLFGVGLREIGNVTQRPADHPHGWTISMISQGLLLLGGFGGAAVAFITLTGNQLRDYLTPRRPVPASWLLLAGALIVLSVPAMSVLIAWNASLDLPAWALEREEQAKNLLKVLTNFSSPLRFVVALLVMAVVPAVGEELFFRGVFQRNLVQWAGRHAGIWLAAAIFSAAHFQFMGFVPRFVLGLVLGYLYEWSGNILVPMAAHFAQNAFQLALLYAQQREWTAADFDPDSTEALPWYWAVLSVVVCAALLWQLRRLLAGPTPAQLPTEMHTLGSHGVALRRPASGNAAPRARTLSHDGVDSTRS
ncbi:CPBP family intramembrane glutamic endopeptidase [Hymenobacter weizhouensis]|uniref:CPBP family intramembrane glutamic endopeptidase n=1 Tax=Hymenobacter sp. YIM 151500-1 TaxID=2987689 RepID=UPI0022263685|nr:CPBP family intramembrane glutamic endopeptidase [Hymenobacter sp. YIM 151500-1]UYZ62140.1 CPBP family intramembrane metalloprotease [Hymenobacter sp. YIM 151500-1]